MKTHYFFDAVAGIFLLAMTIFIQNNSLANSKVFTIGPTAPITIPVTWFSQIPTAGDTIKILSTRTQTIKFTNLTGSANSPIVIINSGGQVCINDSIVWGALTFDNCKYIKVSGRGSSSCYYGFKLSAHYCGLSFAEFSSDCEAENIEIYHTLFFGIYAKKDFGGNPPFPYPRFNNLVIHDVYIHNVEEGMYVGETKSPGMEFHHVRLYNNLVTQTGREAIQLANCVEDVEVYNNFCSYAGLAGIYAQSNNLQVGGNTIGRYYNNILIHAKENGLICLGSGDIEVFNNYVSDNDGIYCDNREFNTPYSSISFKGNYFRNTTGNEVIMNANQLNDFHIRNNFYNTDILFAQRGKPSPAVWDISGNTYQPLDSIRYTISNGIFIPGTGNPSYYNGLGPVPGLSHQMNCTPVIDSIGPVIVQFGDTLSKPIIASTADNDALIFTMINLPSFAQFNITGNGQAVLSLLGSQQNMGVYYPTLLVHDSSNTQYARETFKLAIKNPLNHNPQLSLPGSITMESVSKRHLNVTASDPDHDPITYTFTNLPGFITFNSTTDSAWLEIKPLLADQGLYDFTIMADDGFGFPNSAVIHLVVNPATLVPGKILYRVNCAGPELEDQPINWQSDGIPVPVYATSVSNGTGSHSWSGINQTGAPNNLFGPFRHYGPAPRTMGWSFPIPTNGKYRVKLFFSERSTEVNNNTTGTFDVSIEDSTVLHAFNIYNSSGYAACSRQFDINVYDDAIDIQFIPILNDAKINGFEISLLEKYNNPPSIQGLGNIEMPEGNTLEMPLIITDDHFINCDNLNVSLQNAPAFIALQQINNNWKLVSTPGYADAGMYNTIILSATDGCLSRTLSFNAVISDVFINTPPVLSGLSPVSLNEGVSLTYPFSATDADNQTLTFSFSSLPSFVQYQPNGNGFGKFLINPGFNNSGSYDILVTVSDTYGATDSDILHLVVVDVPEIVRIPLNSSMITDLVRPPYGSTNSPNYLVDEQGLNPMTNQHAVSLSWKPYFNLTAAPYLVYFNLGDDYIIKKIYLHDMNAVADLFVSYGTPGQWISLFTEPCNSYNAWKLHETNISTRYICLSMTTSVYAAVNEIAVYGYPDPQKSSAIEPVEHLTIDAPSFYPNPCNNILHLGSLIENSIVELYSITGTLVNKTNSAEINTSQLPEGVYILSIINGNSWPVTKKIVVNHKL
ncbi:MAG: T9SS type A sorting domain-containing protein [Bacteroidetes bacterium]|nr:T9SS type A sorting domain-containing protein [Bacteroidota bacterium]